MDICNDETQFKSGLTMELESYKDQLLLEINLKTDVSDQRLRDSKNEFLEEMRIAAESHNAMPPPPLPMPL